MVMFLETYSQRRGNLQKVIIYNYSNFSAMDMHPQKKTFFFNWGKRVEVNNEEVS